jgi:hypothetical protein
MPADNEQSLNANSKRTVFFWKDKEEKEVKIILPQLYFEKQN